MAEKIPQTVSNEIFGQRQGGAQNALKIHIAEGKTVLLTKKQIEERRREMEAALAQQEASQHLGANVEPAEAVLAGIGSFALGETAETPRVAAETEVSPEAESKLDELVQTGVSAIYTWARSRTFQDGVVPQHSSRNNGGYNAIWDERLGNMRAEDALLLSGCPLRGDERKQFKKTTEVVSSLTPPAEIKAQLLATLGTEDMQIVRYQDCGSTYNYPYGKGRAGGTLEFGIVLPTKQADELIQLIRSEPKTIRRLVERCGTEKLGFSREWGEHEQSPPYSEWREINKGHMYMQVSTEDQLDSRLAPVAGQGELLEV